SLVDVRETGIKIGKKECVGRKLDELAAAPDGSRDLLVRTAELTVSLLDSLASLLHQKRQIDDDKPINGEQQRLKRCSKKRMACTLNECIGGEWQADQDRANPGPCPREQTGRQDRRKEQHEWNAGSGPREKPHPKSERNRYGGDAEEIATDGVLEKHG